MFLEKMVECGTDLDVVIASLRAEIPTTPDPNETGADLESASEAEESRTDFGDAETPLP